MRLALLILATTFATGCKSRSDSEVSSAETSRKTSKSPSAAPSEYNATAKLENGTLTFSRAKNAGDYLSLNVVRFAKADSSSFDIYGKKTAYPALRSKCVIPGKEWSCDRDLNNPKFGKRVNFGDALKFVKNSGSQAVYQGHWPCAKVVEFVSEKPSSINSVCAITAKVNDKKKIVYFTVKVQNGLSLADSGIDLVALPMPFVNQPLQKEVVLAAMKRIRERWPDHAVSKLGAVPLNPNMGTKENNDYSRVIGCNENFVPWWSDIVMHYYCQLPGYGVRQCFSSSIRGGFGYQYRPYFTPITGLEGTSFGGAFDFCLHDGAQSKKTPFYERFENLSEIPDGGFRGNYKWLAVTPVIDDAGQQFLNSEGNAITHGDVFEYIMSSGVAIGSKLDMAEKFDRIAGDMGSKLFALEAAWQEHFRKNQELVEIRSQTNAAATWVDPDSNTCATNQAKLVADQKFTNCRGSVDKAGCEALPGCLWDTCDARGVCMNPALSYICSLISSKEVCSASPECVVSSTGGCVGLASSGSADIVDVMTEIKSITVVIRKINDEIESLKAQLKPLREQMHFNDNFSTISTFNNDDQQWVINRFYNLDETADQKVCEPNIVNGFVSGYKTPPDGTCCADSRFHRIGQEGRTGKVRFQRNVLDERGARDNLCEKDASGECLRNSVANLANICRSAPLPAGAVINNPEM